MSVDGPVSKFPAPPIGEHVLKVTFADAWRFFLPSMIEIDMAHRVMLRKRGIVTAKTAAACVRAIRSLDLEALRAAPTMGPWRTLFFLVQRKIGKMRAPTTTANPAALALSLHARAVGRAFA